MLGLLTTDERGYYLDDRRLAGATVAAGKVNRLAGILLGRQNPPAGTVFSSPVQASPEAPDAAPQAEAPGEPSEST